MGFLAKKQIEKATHDISFECETAKGANTCVAFSEMKHAGSAHTEIHRRIQTGVDVHQETGD